MKPYLIPILFLTCAFTLDQEVDPWQTVGCRFDVELPPGGASGPSFPPPETGAYMGQYLVPATLQDIDEFPYDQSAVFVFHDFLTSEDALDFTSLRTFDDPGEADASHSTLDLAEIVHDRGGILAVVWALDPGNYPDIDFWYDPSQRNGIAQRIISGEFDTHIRTEARRIRDRGVPIMLSLFAEINVHAMFAYGDGTGWMLEPESLCDQYGDPAWPDGPERLRDAHRHVVDIFREEGAEVTWFFYTASNYMDPDHEDQTQWHAPQFIYPGDDYVDWIGSSVYFSDRRIQVFGDEITDLWRAAGYSYGYWKHYGKPIFWSEFGMVSDGFSRADMISSTFFLYIPIAYPEVKMITFAQSDLFSYLFSLPDLGQYHADELDAWNQFVVQLEYYR